MNTLGHGRHRGGCRHGSPYQARDRPVPRILGDGPVNHGRYTTYGSGCRCKACTDAKTQYERQRRWFNPGKRGRTVVPGWRDQFCPVCEAGPFVSATTHVVRVHGITVDEQRERWGILSSDLRRVHTAEAWDEMLHRRRRAVRARLRRWALLLAEEVARHPDDVIERCARRWRISYTAANMRVMRLRRAGLTDYLAPPRTTCRRGHPLVADNVLINATSGHRQCKICVLDWRNLRPKNCPECGTPISRQGTWCRSCAGRRNARIRNLKEDAS